MYELIDGNNYCPSYGLQLPASNVAQGSDGIITATIDANLVPHVFDVHGNQLNPSYKVEDTNGNYLLGSGRAYSAGSVPGLGVPPKHSTPYTSSTTNVSFTMNVNIDLNATAMPENAKNPTPNCPTNFIGYSNSGVEYESQITLPDASA